MADLGDGDDDGPDHPGESAPGAVADLREAVAFFVIAMIRADGIVEETELDAARATLARCILFSEQSVEEDRALLRRMEGALVSDAGASAARYGPVLAVSPWRHTTLAIMATIMASDGCVDAHELTLIREVARQFGITEGEIQVIIDNIDTQALEDLITGDRPDAIDGLYSVRPGGARP